MPLRRDLGAILIQIFFWVSGAGTLLSAVSMQPEEMELTQSRYLTPVWSYGETPHAHKKTVLEGYHDFCLKLFIWGTGPDIGEWPIAFFVADILEV